MKTVSIRTLGVLSTVLVLSGFPAVYGASVTKRATVCNGYAQLCERGYGTLTYVGTHNSYAVGVNNLAANQDYNITQQLNDGVRLLQVQAHTENGIIRLCHTDCRLYDGGSFENYLKTVKSWLDANPNEVLSLLIVNSGNAPATQYASVYVSTGLDAISYKPTAAALPAAGWPTLGQLIDSNQRVITFLSTTANYDAAPYLIDEFTNVWETAFNVVDIAKFDCTINRGNGDPSTQLFLINHFLDKLVLGQAVPDIDKLNQTNAASGTGSLGAHVDTCRTTQGRPPNFLLVDFYEYGGGSVFEVAAGINGVTYSPPTPVATPISTAVGTQTPKTSGAGSHAVPLGSPGLFALLGVAASSILIAPLLLAF